MDTNSVFNSRFEYKYFVAPQIVPLIRSFITPFVRPDRFSAAATASPLYSICSLYLDTEDLLTYRQSMCGEKNRFKIRIRTYSDDPSSPAFFEVKGRTNAILHKKRLQVSRGQVEEMLRGGSYAWLQGAPGALIRNFDFVWSHLTLAEAKPVIRIKYLREAYEPTGGEPVRITFDTHLVYAPTLGNRLSHAAGPWTETPVEGTILEIKFTERFPEWLWDLVHHFDLRQESICKYVRSLGHALNAGSPSSLAIAGMTVPPRR